MDMTRVSSSNLRNVGYDNDQQLLRIQFHSGGTYDYFNVPEEIYTALINAGSKGTYHHNHIKHRFKYKRVFNNTPSKD